MSKVSLLWWGDTATGSTGFSTVARNVLTGLMEQYPDQYDITQLAIGHHPYQKNDALPFRLVSPVGDNESNALFDYTTMNKPDLVIMNHDIWITKFAVEDRFKNRDFPIAFYHPIDGVTQQGGIPFAWRDWVLREDFTITYADWACDAFYRTCPEQRERLFAITHGVDLDLYQPIRNEQNEDVVIVGMVAMNQYRKEHPTLIRAMAKVMREMPNVALYLHCPSIMSVGYDLKQLYFDYQIPLERIVDVMVANEGDPANNKKVSEGGVVPIIDMPRIYSMMDIHALITTGEGFGLPHAEAMACGTPAIATDYTTLHDMMPFDWQRVKVMDYRPIHVIPLQRAITDVDDLAQKIYHLAKMSRQDRWKLGDQCREFIKRYDWNNTISMWHHHIQRMVAMGRKG